jgi:thioredoxin reductase
MGMLLTTALFVAVTAASIALHLRASRAARGGTRAHSAGGDPRAVPSCPRCALPLPEGAAFCPSCKVPLQAYEFVSAPLAAESPAAAATESPHPVVRADVCVGCGTCVAACPEEGALRLENKRAIVDPDRCLGHGECVKACPVGAIILATGSAVQSLELPDVNANFETNIPGLYVVGELGGRGLIKNAINEGKIAAEHVARQLADGTLRAEGGADALDLVIVGSGPAGISAALEAHRAGLRYVALEQGTLSDTIRKYPRRKLLLAEPVRVPLYGDLWVADSSKEALLAIWERMIADTGVQIRTGQRVVEVAREDGLFRVVTTDRAYTARRVVLAMGRRGTPRRLDVPGEERENVFYDVVEMEAFAGQRVLVVGGGDTAVETALGLANQEGTQVTLSYRGDAFNRIKERNGAKLRAALSSGRVSLLLNSQVREIRDGNVLLDQEGRPIVLPNDVVLIRIGGEAPYPFLQRIGVRIVRKEIARVPADAAAG